MLPFLYDPSRNKEKEKFVQEQLRIEMYIPEYLEDEEKDESKEIDSDRGIEIYQL